MCRQVPWLVDHNIYYDVAATAVPASLADARAWSRRYAACTCSASGTGVPVVLECQWYWSASGTGVPVVLECQWYWEPFDFQPRVAERPCANESLSHPRRQSG
eukprot:SAG11_NODE_1818_length_4215_cov_1.631438_5_plen_103_part_00